MKTIKAICAICLLAMQTLCADVYYNNKTFTANETTSDKVYIGHANGEGDSANALVTIPNGITWTAGNYVSVGCVANESSFLKIEKGGTFTSTSVLMIGGNSGATGIVTNEGTANIAQIYMAPHGRYDLDKKAGWQYKTARFDNFGVLNISTMLLVGQCVPSTTDVEAESSIFYNHSGATLNLEKASGEALGIGRRSPGRLVNEGVINCEAGLTVSIGQKYVDGAKGTLELIGSSTFVPGSETIVGSATSDVVNNKGVGYGYLYMRDNSFFGHENATLKLGNSYYANSRVVLEDNAKLSVASLNVCNAHYVNAKITLKDDSVLEYNGNLRIAGGVASTGCVELVGHSMTSYPTDIYLGTGSRAFGTFRLGGDTSLNMDKEVRFGLTSGSLGCIELADTSSLTLPESFGIHGYADGASAVVSVTDEATLTAPGELLIGCTNKYGCLKVQDSAKVSARKISIAYPDASKDFVMHGDLEISGSAVVTNVAQILLGRGTKALGTLKLNGGSLFLDYRRGEENSITLGSNGGFTDGVIRGWGWLGFDDARKTMVDYATELGTEYWAGMTFCGQIIADGGVLDFSRGPVPTWAATKNNDCGTNGFFAVNKGLLKLQRSLPRKTANHKQVGMMPSYSDNPVMVNTFKYTFDTATMNTTGTYMFSELYATDRTDIPAGLPSGRGIHPSSIFRIGHFNSSATPDVEDSELTEDHKAGFSSLKLKFHYDPALAEIEEVRHVKVYRHDGTANGSWRCVASTAPSAESPYVETVNFTPSTALWNAGWFAVVGTPRVGTVMVIR